MHPHVAEVVAEAGLHVGANVRGERFAPGAHHLVHRRRGLLLPLGQQRSGTAVPGGPLHLEQPGGAGGVQPPGQRRPELPLGGRLGQPRTPRPPRGRGRLLVVVIVFVHGAPHLPPAETRRSFHIAA